jgi:F-type H+-transporting ATPase subunit delta
MGHGINVYGQALYSLAYDEGAGEQILVQLKMLADAFAQTPDFITLLSTPSITKQERCQILDDSFRGRVHPYTLNFLKLLTERGYLRFLNECCDEYERLYNADNGILPVTAVTARQLPAELEDKLVKKLAEITGKQIQLTCRLDPKVLGGILVEYDGKQLDGTVARRLDDIRRILKSTVL